MTSGTSDAHLLAAASRDPRAFHELYERHATAVHAFAVRRVRDQDAALEVTAETFARAWYGRRKFRDKRGGTALPWLYGIAANVIRESARRHQMSTKATDRLGISLGIDREPIAPDPSWLHGLDADLEAALADLSPEQREAVLARVVDDAPYNQLALALNCSPETARSWVSRGLSNLRRTLQGGTR